jgi:selenide,water dikinase
LTPLDSNEDAAVFKLDSDKAIVQTVDLITPVVDDPYFYGQVAAANSLSDVFAMGGEVLTAMNIVGFDECHHGKEVLRAMLEGARDKVDECRGSIVGGHTIETPEMIFGLSVTGVVHPEHIYRNNTPRIGDRLILTKPLGMGILTTAIKADMLGEERVLEVAHILAQLNYKGSLSMKEFDVSACTDVTGFGLMGHSYEMAGKRATVSLYRDEIPVLPEAFEMASMGIIPAGTYNNQQFMNDKLSSSGDDDIVYLDAQTSGGLLIAVSPDDAETLLDKLREDGYTYSAIVGEVLPRGETGVVLG